MVEHPNAVIVRGLIDAFHEVDIARIADVLAPDVVWHFPGRRGRLAGEHRGQQQVFEFLGQVAALTDGSFTIELIDVVASDERVMVLFRGVATRGDRKLDNPTCLSITLRDGHVAEVWEYVWDLVHVEEFWE